MHDAIAAERRGLPAIAVMTSEFVSAAELMSRVLGAEDYRFVVVEHPVSSATEAELEAKARQAVADGLDYVLAAGSA